MNDNTRIIIEQLAFKLGVTAEHLWGVLLKQAAVSSFIDIVTGFGCVIILSLIIKRIAAIDTTESSTFDGPGKGLAIGLLSAVLLFFVISICCGLPICIAGFTNPEYWALKQIIH